MERKNSFTLSRSPIKDLPFPFLCHSFQQGHFGNRSSNIFESKNLTANPFQDSFESHFSTSVLLFLSLFLDFLFFFFSLPKRFLDLPKNNRRIPVGAHTCLGYRYPSPHTTRAV
jgi:hypothetical protein